MGARVKITDALAQNAKAAKKDADIKAANDQLLAAAKQLTAEEQRTENLRKEVAELSDVLATRPAPRKLTCPITTDLLIDPVVTADGQSYERDAIEKWLRKHDTSPLTGKKLGHKTLAPNQYLRTQVGEFIEHCRKVGAEPDSLL